MLQRAPYQSGTLFFDAFVRDAHVLYEENSLENLSPVMANYGASHRDQY